MSRHRTRPGTSASSASGSPASRGSGSTTELVYDAPSFPLNRTAYSLLGDLSRSQETAYKNQIRGSLHALGHSVYDLQDRLQTQRQRLHQLQTRREERGIVSPDEDRLTSHVQSLERQVDRLTNLAEAAVRDVIDQRIELEDNGAVLDKIYQDAPNDQGNTNGAVTRRQRRVNETAGEAEEEDGDNKDEDEIDQPPPKSILDTYREERIAKKDDHTSKDMYRRYGLENDYNAFKKLWHSGMAGQDGPPLPDPSKWFRADGTPIMGTSIEQLSGESAMDDDIAVAREVISLTCPLSLRQLEEPYSNHKCKHTFERSAILDYLNGSRGPQQCPQTGCSQMFKKSDFATDFYLDEVILRQVQRARQMNEDCEMDVDSDDDVRDQSVIAGPERVMRRGVKQELADRSKREPL
uniref:SP-RING-type domain-containing protein n=1 Tax=Bionectria ochroleuca TaxID=29856 RepID=A0A8H7TRV2_BIOOC